MADFLEKNKKDWVKEAAELENECSFVGTQNGEGGHLLIETRILGRVKADGDAMASPPVAVECLSDLNDLSKSPLVKLIPPEAQHKLETCVGIVESITKQTPPDMTVMSDTEFYKEFTRRMSFFISADQKGVNGAAHTKLFGADALALKVSALEDQVKKSKKKNALPTGEDLRPLKTFLFLADQKTSAQLQKWEREIMEKHGYEQAAKAEKRKAAEADKRKAPTNKKARHRVEKAEQAEAEVDEWFK